MNVERYTVVRERLVELFKIITEKTWPVVIPRSNLISVELLKKINERDPYGALDRLEELGERNLTIQRLCDAFVIMDDEVQLGFQKPRRDTVEIYLIIQEYLRLWVEIKTDFSWFNSPPLEELEILEKIAKFVFNAYRSYKMEEITDSFGGYQAEDMSLFNILKAQMVYGADIREGISFISYLSSYRDGQSSNNYFDDPFSNANTEHTMEDFMKSFSSEFTGMGGLGG